MLIYQLHHVRNAQELARSEEESTIIAEAVVQGELRRGKRPVDTKGFKIAIADSIDKTRRGEDLKTLKLDLPGVGLESDPICRACRECPTTMSEDDVEEFLSRKK